MSFIVELRARFIDEDGVESELLTVAQANYEYKGEAATFSYTEKSEDGTTLVTVIVEPERVAIVREGFLSYVVELREGQCIEGELNTPYGSMPTLNRLEYRKSRFDENGGVLELDYILSISDQPSRNRLSAVVGNQEAKL